MFNKIIDPKDNSKISIFSEKGKKILKTYVKKVNETQNGGGGWGSSSPKSQLDINKQTQKGGWGFMNNED